LHNTERAIKDFLSKGPILVRVTMLCLRAPATIFTIEGIQRADEGWMDFLENTLGRFDNNAPGLGRIGASEAKEK
jgi:hypothetical protein